MKITKLKDNKLIITSNLEMTLVGGEVEEEVEVEDDDKNFSLDSATHKLTNLKNENKIKKK